MKNNDLKSVLIDIAEEALPSSEIDLLSTLTRKLAVQKPKDEMFFGPFAQGPLLRRALLTVLALALASTVLLITPQGRAWAQEVFQFFKKVNFTTIPISAEEQKWMNAPVEQYDLPLVPVLLPTLAPEIATLADCQTPQDAQSYACQIAHAETKLGFDLKEFPGAPQGLEFWSVRVDDVSQTASIGYGQDGWQLRLTQGLGKFQDHQYGVWTIVPADKVETIKVGSLNGEYVNGGFVLPNGGNAWVWQGDIKMDQHIAWSYGSHWFLLEAYTAPGMTGYLNRSQLIELAASLVDSPIVQTDELTPDSLPSISDAEKYSGLDLKAPTLLPLGYGFSFARYFSFNNEIHLRYDGNGYLVIYEWKGKSLDLNTLSNTSYKNYEIVKVDGKTAFYGSTEGTSPYLFLWWSKNGLNYQMYSYQYTEGIIGVLDKEDMIAIAESMEDVNDFRRNTSKSYQYIDIYKQALGIDVKEFPTTPVGWSFSNVLADAYARCIVLSYISTTERGRLSLSQCGTDTYFDLSNIPLRAIERVKIGKIKAQYIVGYFDVDNNGKTFWNSNLPLRTLRWQENGHWIEISLHGGSVVLYDKEDLISYAESLR